MSAVAKLAADMDFVAAFGTLFFPRPRLASFFFCLFFLLSFEAFGARRVGLDHSALRMDAAG